MSGKRYTAEFKAEAIKQALTPGRSTREVAQRLGLNKHSLYHWIQQYRASGNLPAPAAEAPDAAEVRRLRSELKRVIEERDVLKKAVAYFSKGSG
jgi:transposase